MGGGATIRDIKNAAENAYREFRARVIEGHILSAYGMTWSEYMKLIQEGKLTDLHYRIISQVESYRLELEVLIAGVDDTGAHIYQIENPGYASSFDDIGYAAIGSGEYHAIRSFIENNYSVNFPVYRALYVVYEAKKYAEFAPGVGKKTDIVIVTKEGIKTVSDDLMEALEEAYNAKISTINKVLKEDLKDYFENIHKLLDKDLQKEKA